MKVNVDATVSELARIALVCTSLIPSAKALVEPTNLTGVLRWMRLSLPLRASRRERETRRPESDVTGMTRNAPSRLPLRNRNTSGEIGYDYSHFGEEDPHARLPKPRPDS